MPVFLRGGPVFLGKIAWGCQISWGAKFPVTTGREPASRENDNAAGEAMKKRPVFGRLLSLSATYVQGSAMAAAGEWRGEVGCSKLSNVSPAAPTCRPYRIAVL